MSKKFIIIEKDSSKWLRPVNPFDNNDPRFTSKEPFCMLGMRPCSKTVCECDEWKKFEKNNLILPYIGSRPEGTTVDEGEVREVVQYRQKDNENADWQTWAEGVIKWDNVIETRIAYADAESHDRQISDDYPGIDYQPLFNHMSKAHGLTLTTGEMDEIIGLSTYILSKK